MKKKGLIISTVVMVIVLIASLTTATYAWFTAGSTVSVNDITMSVVTGSDVAIGMAKTNAYKANATIDDFVNGSLTWDGASADAKWTGDAGLSSTVNTNLPAIEVSKAISTAVAGTDPAFVVDATSWVEEHSATVVKASGNGATVTAGSAEAAVMNAGKGTGDVVTAGDYISLAMGVQAVAPNLKSIGCVITVEPTGTKATIGMNAAIHVRWRLNGGDWNEEDVYGDIHYNTAKNSASIVNANPNIVKDTDGTTNKTMVGAQSIKINVEGSDANTTALTGETINQLELVVFIAGYDDTDCNNAAMGSSALIHINFVTDTIAA